jgi:hypothetical protein
MQGYGEVVRASARTAFLAALGTLVALGVLPAAASADHHLMKIREVYPGTVALPGSEFVELQMYSPSQTNLDPASRLDFYDNAGSVAASVGPLDDVDAGESQRTVLIGTAAAASGFAVTLDQTYAGDNMSPGGGAVCFESTTFGRIDCVRWGTMTNPPAGTGAAEGAIPDGSSIERSIAPRCSTLLEVADDTDDSAADFAPATPSPRNNALAPIDRACPDTEITKKPKQKTTDRTPRFKFVSAPTGEDFQCKLDDAEFEDCESPLDLPRQSRGKHAFKVKAGSDPTPAAYSWKIVKP